MKANNMMTNTIRVSIVSTALLMTGCMHQQQKDSPSIDIIGEQVKEMVAEIGGDIRQMTRMTQPQQPKIKVYRKATGPLSTPVTIKWSGDIEKVTESIAKLIGFTSRVVGRPPLQKIYVSINIVDEPAFKVLEDIGMQAGNFAGIVVNERLKEVRVTYLENK